jgi:hypothetical protein
VYCVNASGSKTLFSLKLICAHLQYVLIPAHENEAENNSHRECKYNTRKVFSSSRMRIIVTYQKPTRRRLPRRTALAAKRIGRPALERFVDRLDIVNRNGKIEILACLNRADDNAHYLTVIVENRTAAAPR